MKNTSIHLDRLDLTVSGVYPDAAQAAIASLGPELARALEDRIQDGNTAPVVRSTLEAGVIRVTSATDAPALCAALAAQIARAAMPNRNL